MGTRDLHGPEVEAARAAWIESFAAYTVGPGLAFADGQRLRVGVLHDVAEIARGGRGLA